MRATIRLLCGGALAVAVALAGCGSDAGGPHRGPAANPPAAGGPAAGTGAAAPASGSPHPEVVSADSVARAIVRAGVTLPPALGGLPARGREPVGVPTAARCRLTGPRAYACTVTFGATRATFDVRAQRNGDFIARPRAGGPIQVVFGVWSTDGTR
jgi:hypothetical protein